MALLDASPSRERLGRVVELLRGVEEEGLARRSSVRRRKTPRAVRPLPAAWPAEDPGSAAAAPAEVS